MKIITRIKAAFSNSPTHSRDKHVASLCTKTKVIMGFSPPVQPSIVPKCIDPQMVHPRVERGC